MDELTPEQRKERLEEDYTKGRRRERRGPDRRKRDRRKDSRLTPAERFIWFTLVVLASFGVAFLSYSAIQMFFPR